MPRKKHELSAAEWELMQVIWDREAAVSVREVLETAYPNDEKAYTTVQTLMNILVDKGFLRRKKSGMVNLYSAAVKREKVLDAGIAQAAERMFSGSVGAMASFLVNSRKLSDDDVAELRKLLDEKERGES
ncbi:MAG: CopY family transcriptional regulator [Ignavibacteria bacterium]|nr:MAG: CopY family transcriptional regulator [Ignavibacteria bacterium]